MNASLTESAPALRLLVAGLNHKTAPLAMRETVAFSPAQIAEGYQEAVAEYFRRLSRSSQQPAN